MHNIDKNLMTSFNQGPTPKREIKKNTTSQDVGIQKLYESIIKDDPNLQKLRRLENQTIERLNESSKKLKSYSFFQKHITKRSDYNLLLNQIKTDKIGLAEINKLKNYAKENLEIFDRLFTSFRDPDTTPLNFQISENKVPSIRGTIKEAVKNDKYFNDVSQKMHQKLSELVENEFDVNKVNIKPNAIKENTSNNLEGIQRMEHSLDDVRLASPLGGKYSSEEKELIKKYLEVYQENHEILEKFSHLVINIPENASENEKLNTLINLYMSKQYINYNKALLNFMYIHKEFQKHPNLKDLFTNQALKIDIYFQRLTRVKMPMDELLKLMNVETISKNTPKNEEEALLLQSKERITQVADVVNVLTS